MTSIGFLHPGEMGISLAAAAINSASEVYWCSENRSEATALRAQSQRLTAIPTLDEFCSTCDIIVSVCPPHGAIDLAEQVRDHHFKGIFADVNAISPDTVHAIAKQLSASDIDFVDGGIIGLPAWKPGTTWLYLSGEKASQVASCFSNGPLEVTVLNGEVGKASALKICYAAQNKGSLALLAAVMGMAEHYGVRDKLEQQWDIYNPGFTAQTHKRIQSITHKAWRFTGEMEEIAETMQTANQPPGYHQAAADTYSRLAGFKDQNSPPDIENILKVLLEEQNRQS